MNISLDDSQAEVLAEALAIAADDFNFDGEHEKADTCHAIAKTLGTQV